MTPSSEANFKHVYQTHLNRLKLDGLQPKTIEAYARAIRRIGAYFDHRIEGLCEQQLTEYFTDLLASHSWSAVKLDLYGLKSEVLLCPCVAQAMGERRFDQAAEGATPAGYRHRRGGGASLCGHACAQLSRVLLHRLQFQFGEEPQAGSACTSEEKEELRRLRVEVKQLRIERDILKKAAAFFARESS